MKPNALVLALVTAATALPGSARAADDFCSRIFIYAINQICQLLPNGQTLCQPVGLAGPGPSCDSPSAQQLVQIPLGPPAIQMSPFSPFASAPSPYAANPFPANPFAANSYPPFPFAPNLFAPAAAHLPPSTPPTQPPALPPVVAAPARGTPDSYALKHYDSAAPVKPAAVVEPAPTAPAEKPLAKLMPATAPSAAVARTTPPVPPAKAAEPLAALPPYGTGTPLAGAAPVAPAPVKPAAAPAAQAAQAPAVAPIAASPAAAPVVAAVAPIEIKPIAPDAAAKAEIARAQAEKAIEEALAHFEFDSAELTPVGRAMLDSWLAQASGDTPIVVTGHADRLGPEPYNEKLSLLRAEAVKKYLTEKGKPANRIQILAKGESMPVTSCAGDANPETKACLAPNRRAEVVAKPIAKASSKAKPKPTIKPKTKPAKVKPAR